MSDSPTRTFIVEIDAAVDADSATAAVAGGRGKATATVDAGFVVALPRLVGLEAPVQAAGDATATAPPYALDLDPSASTTLVRVSADETQVEALRARDGVVGVFSDPEIQACVPVCPGGAARGTTADVAAALCAADLHAAGADGTGVLLAVVDTGINLAHLHARGLNPTTDPSRSWTPFANQTPFQMPVGHGTMCAYDALIAAPRATLLDIPLLTANGFSGVLSEGIRAYRHLIDVMSAPRRPGDTRSLVVNNSWAMFHSSWDLPVGHPGNYSHNPNHPFNRIVAQLEAAGADIVFAAGNCGANCPDGRCQGVTNAGVTGANGHPSVLTVAGVDVNRERAGYSTQGPGTLAWQKPDVAGYTHFQGSGVYAADGGTSAASPVVAGVVAAVRTRRPFQPGLGSRTPAAIRTLLRSTAIDLGSAGYDFDHGFGVVDGCALARRIRPIRPVNICDRFPGLCGDVPNLCARFPWLCPKRFDLCERYPWICEGVQEIDRLPIPDPGPIKALHELVRELERVRQGDRVANPDDGVVAAPADASAPTSGGCGCGGGC